MRIKLLILISILTAILTACGQGGSSSDNASFASSNRFVGTQAISISSELDVAAFAMNVSGSNVSIDDENFSASGILNTDGQFSVTSPSLSISVDKVTCTGSISYVGSVLNDSISGNLDGLFSCTGVEFPVSGTFSATRGASRNITKTFLNVVLQSVE
jgi:hypothetical protein